MDLSPFTRVALVGVLGAVVFLIVTLIDGQDLGPPTGMLTGFGLIGIVTFAFSRRNRT